MKLNTPVVLLLLCASFLISCQSLSQRQGEWTYVGDENPNTLEAMADCERRAGDETNGDTYPDYYDPDNPYAGVVTFFSAVAQQDQWQKSFDDCMNVRDFARQGDVDRVRRIFQEHKEVRDKQRTDDALLEARAKSQVVKVGDFVVPKFDRIVIYSNQSTNSERIAVGDFYDMPRVLHIDGEWTQVELQSNVGWARSQTMKKEDPLIP